MAYIDLEELPALLGGRLLRRVAGSAALPPLRLPRRPERSNSPTRCATPSSAQLGGAPEGPVRLLTTLRSFGLCFNPVSFYYCFDRRGSSVEAVLAEVTNTPWGERQAYVIAVSAGSFEKRCTSLRSCRWTRPTRSGPPRRASGLSVTIENHRARADASSLPRLRCERVELTPAAVRRIGVRYPLADGSHARADLRARHGAAAGGRAPVPAPAGRRRMSRARSYAALLELALAPAAARHADHRRSPTATSPRTAAARRWRRCG